MPADKARYKALEYFKAIQFEQKHAIQGPWVYRLLLTTGASFKTRKQFEFKKSGDPFLSAVLTVNMPHFVWIAEAYTVDGYKKGVCCAEIVQDATAGCLEKSVLYVRVGKMLYFNSVEIENPLGIEEFRQYTHNLGEAN